MEEGGEGLTKDLDGTDVASTAILRDQWKQPCTETDGTGLKRVEKRRKDTSAREKYEIVAR